VLKRWAAWPQGIRWLAGGIAAVVLALVVAWALFVPAADWLAHNDVGSAKGPLLQTARDDARGRLLTLGAGLFAAAALLFTARNFTLSREGQVTDRYTKAIEQLGSDKLDVRVGGIYALERVARDSARDHPTVMEVLTAFIREHSHEQWPPPDPGGRGQKRSIRPDVQAAITVVVRRDAKRDIGQIDLNRANLTRANLYAYANLAGADLSYAQFTGANLAGANLTSAQLTGADLAGAYLIAANLTSAQLTGADLAGADLTSANLTTADLTTADLTSTNLTGANLAVATWPADTPVPEGWKLDAHGRLTAAGTDSGPTEAN
jgi:Pentapeptide repeats (8 copies)